MFRMMMGGREHEKENRVMQPGDTGDDMEMRRRRSAYSDGYDDGRKDAEREMRRRSSMRQDEPESRRGARSHEEEQPEARQIGFAVSPDERKEMRMMLHEMHELHDRMEHMTRMGSASVKKLAKPLEGVLDDAAEIIKNPPATWDHYLEKDDIAGIVKTEGKELLGALDEGKAPGAVRKEFTHTMAALLLMMSSR